jgi:hypothetical protein
MEEVVGRKVTVFFKKARLDGHFELLFLLIFKYPPSSRGGERRRCSSEGFRESSNSGDFICCKLNN